MSPMKEIHLEVEEDEVEQELRVTFFPKLHDQRKIWVLDVLRKENITKILDVGCGEGELLSPLCQPAIWLDPPPPDRLPPESPDSSQALISPTFNLSKDSIPNLHPSIVHGLDISPNDLTFAVRTTSVPEVREDGSRYTNPLTRFEPLDVKIWEGGLEAMNEEFVGIECIVGMEVIEHLSPSVFPFFTPMLLGVYHPTFLLVTTPSYTFNARFKSPDAPPSVRKGFPDPTQRTSRVFRHSDHKFEWTREEFAEWVEGAAKEWGYEATASSIGRATETDPWGRDEELGGATFVVQFRKLETASAPTDEERARKGREVIAKLAGEEGSVVPPPHKLVAHHHHPAHPSSKNPRPLSEIAALIKTRMELDRESLMYINELWFNKEVSTACGGWIEFLLRAVEESKELTLKKEENGMLKQRDSWMVEIVGGSGMRRNLWLDTDSATYSEALVDDYVPEDWTPGEESLGFDESTDFGESTGAEGDISLNNTDDEAETRGAWSSASFPLNTSGGWGSRRRSGSNGGWGEVSGGDWGNSTGWGSDNWNAESSEDETSKERKLPPLGTNSGPKKARPVASSTAGWDGDEDESDSTTS